jgi:hypothetical protein
VPFDDVADRAAAADVQIYHLSRVHMASLEQYWIPDGKVMSP